MKGIAGRRSERCNEQLASHSEKENDRSPELMTMPIPHTNLKIKFIRLRL